MSGRSLTGGVLSGILAWLRARMSTGSRSAYTPSRDMVAQRWPTHVPARGHERRSNVGS